MMKNTVLIWALLMGVLTANDNVVIDGHVPGRPTMDLEAAKKYAIAKNLPLLLNFTGSDWCGWCKIMEKNVFSQESWGAYAKGNIVMVWLDYPKDKTLVPEKYVKRNNDLRAKYEVRGYPSYLVIDAKGVVIGKLGAGRDKTPASFRAEVEDLTSMTEKNVANFAKKLDKDKAAEYVKMYTEIKQRQQALEKAKEQYNTLVKESNARIDSLKSAMQDSRAVNGLSAKEAANYLSLKKELKEAKLKLQSFVSSAPEKNLENMAKYEALGANIKELQAKLAAF